MNPTDQFKRRYEAERQEPLHLPDWQQHCDQCHESNEMAIVEFEDCKIVCCCEAVILINQSGALLRGEAHAKRNRVSEQEETTVSWGEASKTVH